MAESESSEKTEEPTPRRLEKALEDGQIAFSSELMSGLALLAGVIFFYVFGRWFFQRLMSGTQTRLSEMRPMLRDEHSLLLAFRDTLFEFSIASGSLMVFVMVISLFSGAMQTRLNLSSKPLNLDWTKLDPMKGAKRVFSSRSLIKGLVAIAKSSAVVGVAFFLSKSMLPSIASTGFGSLQHAISIGTYYVLAIGIITSILMVLIGFIDYAFQRWKQHQDLRMSQQEIRDEYKEVEGDPMIKARVRRLQNERRKKQMMSDVPTATVVVTNPTHFAVALRYDPENQAAPIVVAKGVDFVAFKIIEIAKEHRVPVVERKPLARFMYANVEIGSEIPFEAYQAMAEILNYIKRTESLV